MAPDDAPVSRGTRRTDPHVSKEWLKSVNRQLLERGWTRRKLAKNTGISETVISRLFKAQAGKPAVRKVASVLGLPDPFDMPIDADSEWDEWIRISERMRTAEPERFRILLLAFRSWDENQRNWEHVTKLTTR